MSDVLLAYILCTISLIIGWLKFLPKIMKQKSVYKTVHIISFFLMIMSYFSYINFIENVPDSLAWKYIMFFIMYIALVSFIMYIIFNRFKQTDENS